VAHENTIRDGIRGAYEKRGAWIIPTTRLTPGRHGVPDLLACYRGYFIAIEVKKPTGSKGTTAEQRRELTTLERAGAIARVCTSISEGLMILRDIDDLIGLGKLLELTGPLQWELENRRDRQR
jgi:hypothetical protein